jgi:ribonucleoside-diphosphate reductase alpha chain
MLPPLINLNNNKKSTYMVNIDYSRDALLDSYAIRILKDRYMIEGETSPQDAFARAAKAFADDDAHAQRIYDYASKLWFMFSTPILANGGTKRGLPISCFLSDVPDSREGLDEHYSENIWLASSGGGIGTSWSNLRTNGSKTSTGGQSTGMIPFLAIVDRQVLAFRQAGTRRAAYAAYLDISHPEIIEFIGVRKPSGGDSNRKCLNIHNAVNIPDAFMQKLMAEDDSWDLVDPNSKAVTETVSARALWEQILTLRTETGEPYLHFIDTTNRHLPEAQKVLGLQVNTSNLCSEITLATSDERTAVCCLSSVNLEKWDDWKDTTMVQDLIRMLDNVLDVFIAADNLKPSAKHAIRKAIFSASRERSLGLGAMGWHSLLQSKMIPFESEEASKLNDEIFSKIRHEAEKATEQLGFEKGNCPDIADYYESIKYDIRKPRRNMHLLAIAPNASSSILCGNTSPSIEPFSAVSFSQKTENGTHAFRNKYFKKLLEDKGFMEKEITSVWRSISAKKGSVQHLDILTDAEKEVFKTAFEIDQSWVIKHAADRQKYICQAQSVNLFFATPIDVSYLHKTHYSAWEQGLKTLYYLRSSIDTKTENIGEKVERTHLTDSTFNGNVELQSSSLEEGRDQPTDDTFKQTQFKTVTPTGFEISCYGCE